MLANLLNLPKTADDFAFWSFNHRDSHKRIIEAIQKDVGVILVEYDIDPVNFQAIDQWLLRNQEYHNDMNGILQLQGSDLTGVDFSNQDSFANWILLHWLEHSDAEFKLGIG
jgi:hypothetical protein